MYSEALECLDEILTVERDDPDIFFKRGNALGGLGKTDEALKSFDNALELDPLYVESWNSKGVTYALLKCYEDSIICFDHAID